jgi:phospholipid/cholesterol/gamma-HCH transport system substrate-binding protein
MLTRATRIRLVAFAVITILVIGYTASHYAKLGRFVGLRGYYVVTLNLSNAGGLFQNSDVDYRGVSVGRVGALSLTPDGVAASLDISDSAPPIPRNLTASVSDLSAVGEEYVDLRPHTSQGPYLTGGAQIPERETTLPLPVTSLLMSVNALATSVPLEKLREVLADLGTAWQNEGGNLGTLIDGSASLVRASSANLPQQNSLIDAGQTVLRTQEDEASALKSFGSSAKLLAEQLDASDSDIRNLIVQAPRAATQVAGLLTDNNPGLAVLIANLLTTANLTATRGRALDELLSALPADIAAGSTVITPAGANFGIALTFFNPLPCVAGYGGTVYENGLDTTPAPLNTSARCDEPASQGDVRGSAHAPSGGGVPTPAQPGLSQLLGITP